MVSQRTKKKQYTVLKLNHSTRTIKVRPVDKKVEEKLILFQFSGNRLKIRFERRFVNKQIKAGGNKIKNLAVKLTILIVIIGFAKLIEILDIKITDLVTLFQLIAK